MSVRRHNNLSLCPQSMSGTEHTSLQQHLTEDLQKNFESPSRNTAEKKKEQKTKNIGYCKGFHCTKDEVFH